MEYILTEVLKNAFRATVEHHQKQHGGTISAHSLPPVLVTVVPPPRFPGIDKPATLSVRIRDQGGGVSPANMARIFSYAFTTAGRRAYEDDDDNDGENGGGGGPYAAQHVGGAAAVGAGGAGLFHEMTGKGVESGLGTIAGLGFGLPMSRLYAQ